MENELNRKGIQKLKSIFFKDNFFNKPIKWIIRKTGLYSFVYTLLDQFELHDDISMKLIKKLVRKENPVIVEIGAHIGQDTNRFIKSFNDLKIYSFEPDPRSIANFMKNVRSKKSELIPMAISNKNGTILLHQSSGNKEYTAGKKSIGEWTASSTIKEPVKHADFIKYKQSTKVKTIKLDDWVKKRNIEAIDFIWADVEGSEKELILGGINTLNTKTRYFYTEFSDKEIYRGQPSLKDIKKLLPNFEILGIFGANALMKNLKFD